MPNDEKVELYEMMQEKYLNYAISVISDRALPDVRDGLKPVHRRILFSMFHDLHLYHDSQHRKCAAIVGMVLGKYHPHGDTAAYESLVRMAQNFNMRYPLVEGSGNFGSVDGDNAAAMRYTEARLTPLAEELIEEIKYKTVSYRPNYDGTSEEPMVMPAKWPQLLCNGVNGIAVGMATSIPPHNLTEVLEACIHFVDNRDSQVKDLMKFIKAPDFPSGVSIINSKKELEEIYTTGSGAVTMRSDHKMEELSRGKANIIITSVPFQVNRSTLIENIGQLIQNKKVPQLLDVINESDDNTRVVLELKSKSDEQLVLNYLYKNTNLQTSFRVNLTMLMPLEPEGTHKPTKANLPEMIREFVDHRFVVYKRRFEFELSQLEKRIHMLEGFQAIFLNLDKALKIIRASKGKEDAAQGLMKAFPLDIDQTNAVLETRLYNLAKLEMLKIKEELKAKKDLAATLGKKLGSKKLMWKEVKIGFNEIIKEYGDKRRSKIATRTESTIEIDMDAYIEHEDNMVILTREGWIKRMKEVKSVSTLRVREGDEVISIIKANTKNRLIIITNKGVFYTIKVNDLQYTPGYGEPIQKLFKFKDGEKIISIRKLPEEGQKANKDLIFEKGDDKKSLPILLITNKGMGYRYLINSQEDTTKKGKKCFKLGGEDVLVAAYFITMDKFLMVSFKGKGSEIKISELNTLSSPGKGIKLMKLDKDDYLVAASLMGPKTKLTVLNNNNNEVKIRPGEFKITSRNHAPKTIIKRGRLVGLKDISKWSGFDIPKEIKL
ncbi:MAG: DNA topoisomerase [Planctomycetota bacterium]|nr:MAG: DNA topoisomerase [Planctomycetota bacterium]